MFDETERSLEPQHPINPKPTCRTVQTNRTWHSNIYPGSSRAVKASSAEASRICPSWFKTVGSSCTVGTLLSFPETSRIRKGTYRTVFRRMCASWTVLSSWTDLLPRTAGTLDTEITSLTEACFICLTGIAAIISLSARSTLARVVQTWKNSNYIFN